MLVGLALHFNQRHATRTRFIEGAVWVRQICSLDRPVVAPYNVTLNTSSCIYALDMLVGSFEAIFLVLSRAPSEMLGSD